MEKVKSNVRVPLLMKKMIALLFLLIMILACENRSTDNFLDNPSFENQKKVMKNLKNPDNQLFTDDAQKQRFIILLEEENIFAMQIALEILRLERCAPDFKEYLLQYFGKLFQDKPEFYKDLNLCNLAYEDLKIVILFPLEKEKDLIKKYYKLIPDIFRPTHPYSDDCDKYRRIRYNLREQLSKEIEVSEEYSEVEKVVEAFITHDNVTNMMNVFKVFEKLPGYSCFYLSDSLEIIYKLSDLVEEGSKHAAEVAFYILNNIELYSGAGSEGILLMLSYFYDIKVREFLLLTLKYPVHPRALKTIMNVYSWNDEKYKSIKDEEIYRERLQKISKVKDPKYDAIKKDIIEILTEILDK